MATLMGLLQVIDADMGIDLRRFKGFMAEEFLHGPDIGAVSEHGRGAGMAEGMR